MVSIETLDGIIKILIFVLIISVLLIGKNDVVNLIYSYDVGIKNKDGSLKNDPNKTKEDFIKENEEFIKRKEKFQNGW